MSSDQLKSRSEVIPFAVFTEYRERRARAAAQRPGGSGAGSARREVAVQSIDSPRDAVTDPTSSLPTAEGPKDPVTVRRERPL